MDGETGYICELGDIETAAAGAIQLLSNDKLHQQFSKAAFKRMNETFCSHRITAQYETIYQQL